MNINLNSILKYWGCCLNCGSLAVNDGRLCEKCEDCLSRQVSQGSASLKTFKVKTLYSWIPEKSDVLSRLVLSLKGKRSRYVWRFYAQKFVQEYLVTLEGYQQVCIVPAPSKKFQSVDHARIWSEELVSALGSARLVPCLRKIGSLHQRGADRGERALIEMEVVENNTISVDFSPRTLWIFADDIVTTGATARAAHIALGRPEHFAVWALAERGLSCGASKDLLYNSNA